jgi:hypothetical protein
MSYIGNKQSIALFDSYNKAQALSLFPDKTSGTPQNFAAMPTVGGDPVVESGSNADGEWTRWADGTQSVTLRTTLLFISSSVLQYVWTFPVVFSGDAFTGITYYGAAGQIGGTTAFENAGFRVATETTGIDASLQLLTAARFSSGNSCTVGAIASGRWK